jgi:hypothetical protein
MTQVTADLEFFRCDVCTKFLHRDIFCDHRRECKGPNSQELTRKQADAAALMIDKDEAARRKESGGPSIPLAKLEALRMDKIRRDIDREMAAQEDRKLKEKLQKYDSDALMRELGL